MIAGESGNGEARKRGVEFVQTLCDMRSRNTTRKFIDSNLVANVCAFERLDRGVAIRFGQRISSEARSRNTPAAARLDRDLFDLGDRATQVDRTARDSTDFRRVDEAFACVHLHDYSIETSIAVGKYLVDLSDRTPEPVHDACPTLEFEERNRLAVRHGTRLPEPRRA